MSDRVSDRARRRRTRTVLGGVTLAVLVITFFPPTRDRGVAFRLGMTAAIAIVALRAREMAA